MTNKWTTDEVNRSGYNDKLAGLLKDEYGVILLQGKNAFGDFIYSYVEITLPNLKRFYNAFSEGTNFNPSDFGTVIAAGIGKPTAELVAEIEGSYNMISKPSSPITFETPQTKALPPEEKKQWDEY